jgi:hypothetical protein
VTGASGDGERPPARPDRPKYGEYATPEEVAEARGPLPVQPTDPVSRLAAPISSAASVRAAKAEHPPVPRARPAPPPRPLSAAAQRPRPANNLITVLLIVVGIWNTVTSVPSYLDLGPALTQGLQLAGYGTVAFGAAAHTAGILLLVISCVLLLAAAVGSLQLMRMGRRSIWVPVTAAVLFLVSSVIVMSVVVANTPALTDLLHNQ